MKKIIPIMVMLAVLAAGCVEQQQTLDPFVRNVGGVDLHFRANLTEAANVPVYPNSTTLAIALLNSNVQRIGVAYVSNDTENSYYLADSYEIAYKMTIINRYYFNKTKLVDSFNVSSPLEALSMATNQEPVIMLMGPPLSNSTGISVVGNLVIVRGGSFEEINNTYNELDLATDKLLLVMMNPFST